MAFPPKVWDGFFTKTAFHGQGTNLFRQNIYGEVILTERTSGQIMPR